MVLGQSAKSRGSPSVQVDYLINILEIKPWPPSQSLRILKSVLIQWEHGDKNSGSTHQVAPFLETESGVGNGRIEFNESFRLPVTLLRDISVKSSTNGDTFQKNCIVFNVYEPRRDVKGQLLGTAVVDFALYGVVKDGVSVSVPINCKRAYRNTAQPLLFLKIQAVGKSGAKSLVRRLRTESSMDSSVGESVSSLMNEEYAEETETASYTDDDVSSHSSLVISSALKENGSEVENIDKKMLVTESSLSLKTSSSSSPSADLSSDPERISKKIATQSAIQSDSAADATIHSDNGCQNHSRGPLTNTEIDESSPTLNGTRDNARTEETNKQELVIEIQESGEVAEKGQESGNGADVAILYDNGSQNHSWGPLTNIEIDEISPTSNGTRDNARTEEINKQELGTETQETGEGREVVAEEGQCWKRDRKLNNESVVRSPEETRNPVLERKCKMLERKIETLEGELREVAGAEIGLFSVVAEHGSSTNKVHAPARRLSRLYFHAFKEKTVLRRQSAARSAVSGLMLVAKACGNDVPRLTFWLSNCVLLRAAICKFCEKKLQSPLSSETFEDWDNPFTFVKALEKVESWIVSRTIESLWWQTFTPYMQLGAATSKTYHRSLSSSGGEEAKNFSMELWKKAFRDGYERVCPVRAGGHECGCLHLLSKLIMQQCVARLDVAMFNAILRESVDDMPTDPVSDPIGNSKVLPIPVGKASFEAGAQLKNVIGNWSRWLDDLFGIDDDDGDDDLAEDEKKAGDTNEHERKGNDKRSKPFYLLNALSDLMMLPKDMLLCRTVRKEVCPTFGTSFITRVLNVFVPDEFCPDPIPHGLLEALHSEDHLEEEEESVINFPCAAGPVQYAPPSAAALGDILGDINASPQLTRSGSSVLKKSYTSDDELDALDSSLNFIKMDSVGSPPSSAKPSWMLRGSGSSNGVRYQLLREVWMSTE